MADVLPEMPAFTSKDKTEDKHVHGMEEIRPLQAISHGDLVLPGTKVIGCAMTDWQQSMIMSATVQYSIHAMSVTKSRHRNTKI